MSIKEFFIDFQETHPYLEAGTPQFEFKINNAFLTQTASTENVSAELSAFFHDIFGTIAETERVWVMAQTHDGLTDNLYFADADKALVTLSALCKRDVHLYFSPAIYNMRKRKDKNVKCLRVIFADIDGLTDIDLEKATEQEIKNYLCKNYQLTEAMLPNWLVVSGHGMHLYYLVEPLNMKTKKGKSLQRQYIDYLITYFKADTSCRNLSRILRFPTSKNVKNLEDIKQTRLFHLNASTDRRIERLDCFACSEEQVAAYTSYCNEKRAEKAQATRARNKALRDAAKAATDNMANPTSGETGLSIAAYLEEARKASPQPKSNGKRKNQSKETSKPSHPELRVNLTPMKAKERYRKILRDLHNYVARRGGCPHGFRSNFTHIMASILSRMLCYSEEDAIQYISKYVEEDFLTEVKYTVHSVFSQGDDYMYTNSRIAELLKFQPYDLQQSFAAYTEIQKIEMRQRTQSAYDEKRHHAKRVARKQQRAERKAFIQAHPEMTAQELATTLKCSVRTVYSIKSDIKKSREAA